VQVRAAFVSDADIRDMSEAWTGGLLPGVPALPSGEAA
jgi:hypothetical protein